MKDMGGEDLRAKNQESRVQRKRGGKMKIKMKRSAGKRERER
jgi:hypothetical protein